MTKILKYNHSTIRKALAQLAPGSAHMAAQPPALEEIYAPDIHSGALDSRRSLVVGNRGVGKSFWSSVLADESTRRHVVPAYPRLKLDHLKVILGFHEAAGKLDDAAPSPAVLRSLLGTGRDPEDIWRAVLLRSLRLARNEKPTEPLQETVESIGSNVEAFEATLREFDITAVLG